ncbi:MAG TPA: MerR family transcriptional regulator [Micromonosporaceae bacterium]
MSAYTPAETVSRSGFSLETLRYYERIGLLDDIRRTSGGRRIFDDEDLDWLGVLRCLRDTGMPIATMRRYAELARGGGETMAERLALLRAHAAQVEQTVRQLREQQAHLTEKIGWYAQQIER